MHHHYKDIRALTDKAPVWFDENAVPRFCAFSPGECADIYADEVVLMEIQCQSCDRPFRVCMSLANSTRLIYEVRERKPMKSLAEHVKMQTIDYGDPPNVECCAAGPTMNSIPKRVIEFWEMDRVTHDWKRRTDLEVPIDVEW